MALAEESSSYHQVSALIERLRIVMPDEDARLREELRQRVLDSDLCNADQYAIQMEDLYHQIVEKWHQEN